MADLREEHHGIAAAAGDRAGDVGLQALERLQVPDQETAQPRAHRRLQPIAAELAQRDVRACFGPRPQRVVGMPIRHVEGAGAESPVHALVHLDLVEARQVDAAQADVGRQRREEPVDLAVTQALQQQAPPVRVGPRQDGEQGVAAVGMSGVVLRRHQGVRTQPVDPGPSRSRTGQLERLRRPGLHHHDEQVGTGLAADQRVAPLERRTVGQAPQRSERLVDARPGRAALGTGVARISAPAARATALVLSGDDVSRKA